MSSTTNLPFPNPAVDRLIDLTVPGIEFSDKPILVGGLAMEFYGLRQHGDDIDFIVTNEDYRKLRRRHPDCRKDIWGDLGILYNGYEMFRSIWRFDYGYYREGSLEFDRYRVVSIDTLFRMKVFALGAGEKHREDVELLKGYYMRRENPEYRAYLERHVDRYLAAENGLILNSDFEE